MKKYKHQPSILLPHGNNGGRMRKDGIRRVRANRTGVAVDYRYGKTVVWFFMRPWKLLRG